MIRTITKTEQANAIPATLSFGGPVSVSGQVLSVSGQGVMVSDRLGVLEVGARIAMADNAAAAPLEVVALGAGVARCLPFGSIAGFRRGAIVTFPNNNICHGVQPTRARAVAARSSSTPMSVPGAMVAPTNGWRGRVIDALGRPLDGKGPLPTGPALRSLRATPPPAIERARLGDAVDFGVRAMSIFTPVRMGQRLGLFAAAGVGKSALLSMIARNADCDVAVIALIGERGREVREFIEESLGADGLARSVVIVATADEPALMRREAAYLTMTVAEHFRDQGDHVLCLMDSLTRVAAAQREIGLAAGETPTAKGYTPSVFSLLPGILERAGPGLDRGDGDGDGGACDVGAITGVFSVLVEGNDHDEPVADAARAALDGHVVLSRSLAERGRYPAIDVLKSLSRNTVPVLSPLQSSLATRAKRFMAIYDDMREMVRIGAYTPGSSAEVDDAIRFSQQFEQFLTQSWDVAATSTEAFANLEQILLDYPEDAHP